MGCNTKPDLQTEDNSMDTWLRAAPLAKVWVLHVCKNVGVSFPRCSAPNGWTGQRPCIEDSRKLTDFRNVKDTGWDGLQLRLLKAMVVNSNPDAADLKAGSIQESDEQAEEMLPVPKIISFSGNDQECIKLTVIVKVVSQQKKKRQAAILIDLEKGGKEQGRREGR